MVGTTVLGRYKLTRLLGKGSNGAVYLAEPAHAPGNRVVVKRVHDHVVATPKFRQLFDAEVRSMRNFTHPYAVRLVDASVDDPSGPCLVLEYVPGLTLEAVLAREKRLTPERTGLLLAHLGHALYAAHKVGIVHRDLKPANLMVVDPGGQDESLKVMDFGFAGFATRPHIQLAELTGKGPIHAMGTPAYVSPEMIRGDTVDARGDLYSVGVTLYEMLAGRLPFDLQTQDELLDAHVRARPPRFAAVGRPDVPPAVEDVVERALSKYPNERQQTAKELVQEYGRALGYDLWGGFAPPGYDPEASAAVPIMAPTRLAVSDPYRVEHEFEVRMPEKLAAAKLRGFVEDVRGEVLESEPGVVRLVVGGPPGGLKPPAEQSGSGLFGWLAATRKPPPAVGREPVEVVLQMLKADPTQSLLTITAVFTPLRDHPPRDRAMWRARCDALHASLRQYLGG